MKFFIQKMSGLTLLVLTLLFTTSCKDNTDSNSLDLILLNTTTIDDYSIALYSENELETGMNELYWTVKKDNKTVDVKSFSITPMMDMGSMQHSTPHNEPILFDENDSYFINNTTFIMPSGEMGDWSISFEIETMNENVLIGEVSVDIESSWRLTSVRSEDDKVYFIAWVTPKNPVSGKNELKFMIYTRESMMSFPAVNNAELEIYPYMDMGSGQGHSTDFSEPISKGNGMYAGEINYSMSGTWTTTVQLTVNGNILPEVTFEYSVKAK